MRFPLLRVSIVVALFATGRMAHADDAKGAIDELKQGYALKKGGNCQDAVPHLVRSFQLDAKPKALLNLADCETQMGDLVAAQGHASQGRELAHQLNDAELEQVAADQLAGIEAKVPWLTIKLAAGAPLGSSVSRDGLAIGPLSLGAPFAVNPGVHSVTVTAPGYAGRRFEVTVVEDARQQLEVTPGAALGSGSSAPIVASPEPSTAGKVRMHKLLAYSAFGVGAVGLTVGVIAGLVAGSKHSALQGECSGRGCPPSAQDDLDSFHSLTTVSTLGYGMGLAGIGGGVALWLTTPKVSPGASARVWFGPGSAGVVGAF